MASELGDTGPIYKSMGVTDLDQPASYWVDKLTKLIPPPPPGENDKSSPELWNTVEEILGYSFPEDFKLVEMTYGKGWFPGSWELPCPAIWARFLMDSGRPILERRAFLLEAWCREIHADAHVRFIGFQSSSVFFPNTKQGIILLANTTGCGFLWFDPKGNQDEEGQLIYYVPPFPLVRLRMSFAEFFYRMFAGELDLESETPGEYDGVGFGIL